MFAFSHSSTDINKTTKSSSQFNARTYYNPVKQDKNNEKKIIEYKEVWVYGKSLEQCMGKKKELNEFVLKCRNGYKKTVPVYK